MSDSLESVNLLGIPTHSHLDAYFCPKLPELVKTFVDSPVASEAVLTITEANFESEVTQSTVPVILDFWAEWCGPCRMLGPILDDLAKEQGDKVKVGKVNVDEAQKLAAQFNVRSIPMLVFFKDGVAKDTVVGVQSKDALTKRLAALG